MHPSFRPAMEMLLDWRSMSSLFAALMLLSSLHTYIPLEVRILARKLFHRIFARLKPTAAVIIDEYDTLSGSNDLYDSTQLYLGTRCISKSPSVRLFRPRNTASAAIVASLPDSQTVHDIFQGVLMKWNSRKVEQSASGAGRSHNMYNPRGGGGGECRSLELVFHPRHRDLVHKFYIPHVIQEAARMRYKSRERRLYTNRPSYPGDDSHRLWSSHTFSHPSNFDTLALDPVLRDEIRDDLLRFIGRKDHYMRVGRAWKRGYLLLTQFYCNFNFGFDSYNLQAR